MNEDTLIIWPLKKFHDEYKTQRILGQGQYGEVLLAEHRKSLQKVAAKVSNCSKAKDKLRIRDEIDILKRSSPFEKKSTAWKFWLKKYIHM